MPHLPRQWTLPHPWRDSSLQLLGAGDPTEGGKAERRDRADHRMSLSKGSGHDEDKADHVTKYTM